MCHKFQMHDLSSCGVGNLRVKVFISRCLWIISLYFGSAVDGKMICKTLCISMHLYLECCLYGSLVQDMRANDSVPKVENTTTELGLAHIYIYMDMCTVQCLWSCFVCVCRLTVPPNRLLRSQATVPASERPRASLTILAALVLPNHQGWES